MKPNVKEQFLVWEVEGGTGYWLVYDTLEAAVAAHPEPVEVYSMLPKYTGFYITKATLVKTKRSKNNGVNK